MKRYAAVAAVIGLVTSTSFALAAINVGDKAPSFETITIDGNKAGASDLALGKSLLIVFWATWCPNCKGDIPKIKALNEVYGPKGLRVLGINAGVNDSMEKTERYIKAFHVSYPIVFDKDSVITKSFGVSGVPTVFLIDKTGTIKYRGNIVPDNIVDMLEQARK
jgi:peroxiredoxin